MKHLLICREYPPAPGGGIGTYAYYISNLLAGSGETVHVIGQQWQGAEKPIEEKYSGKLIIHRLPFEEWKTILKPKPNHLIRNDIERSLFNSGFFPLCFSWQVAQLAEQLIKQENIDIIEAQEYEAPLYYLQLRRALGNGLTSHPPCVVHLHSPTELIGQFNDWLVGDPFLNTAKHVEAYSIRTADALLCPSNYLANQVLNYYRIFGKEIQIIPYPIGDITPVIRKAEIWKEGTICYVGRLERRKGVIEWIDAAVIVAQDFPNVKFEFVGDNILDTETLCGEEFVQNRIPRKFKKQFHFHGGVDRSLIPEILAKARIAVVPSRWENFPYTCIEEMGSGLPVIVSPEGGMKEMMEEGNSGWVADQMNTISLVETLKRALQTDPSRLSEMGIESSRRIQKVCQKEKILAQHMEFKSRLVQAGSHFSLSFPDCQPEMNVLEESSNPAYKVTKRQQKGLAIILSCDSATQNLERCWNSIQSQTQSPLAVTIIFSGSSDQKPDYLDNTSKLGETEIIYAENKDDASIKNFAVELILKKTDVPIGLSFINETDILMPDFVARTTSVLKQNSEIDLVSCWIHLLQKNKKRLFLNPPPDITNQWITNLIVPFSAIRTETFKTLGGFKKGLSTGYDIWDLFNMIQLNKGTIITIPEILGHVSSMSVNKKFPFISFPEPKIREKMLERVPNDLSLEYKNLTLSDMHNSSESFLRNQISPKRFYSRIKMKIKTHSQLARRLIIRKKNSSNISID